MIAVLLGLLLLVYSYAVVRRWIAWRRLPQLTLQSEPTARVSVLIAMRNEEQNLAALVASLAAQTYPRHLWEAVLIDDHSTDNSLKLAQELAARHLPETLRVLDLKSLNFGSGKKTALKAGFFASDGKYLLTTDADCLLQPNWIDRMVSATETQEAVFVSGSVCYQIDTANWLGKLQAVEFAALIGVGGASIHLREPNMCNGANLLYSRDAFLHVGGFAGNEHLASGDDEFLLHKIANTYPGKYLFLKDPEAIVYTAPRPTFAALMSQRVRWASKWGHYQSKGPKLLAMLVAAMQAGIVLGLLAALAGFLSWKILVLVICCKFVVEGLFFQDVLRFFGLQRLLGYVALMQLLYIPFVLMVAVKASRGRYSWKGRTILSP